VTSVERKVWTAALPEMRLAYFERECTDARTRGDVVDELWDAFNTWRVEARPALGRIDIAAVGLAMDRDDGSLVLRAAVPIRGDHAPAAPARTVLFPGGAFVYAYADDTDEITAAFEAVREALAEYNLEPLSGPIEVYKFHYNLEQHPCDCGFLVDLPGLAPVRGHAPLPIAR